MKQHRIRILHMGGYMLWALRAVGQKASFTVGEFFAPLDPVAPRPDQPLARLSMTFALIPEALRATRGRLRSLYLDITRPQDRLAEYTDLVIESKVSDKVFDTVYTATQLDLFELPRFHPLLHEQALPLDFSQVNWVEVD